ncbi:hypothetical protein IFM89_004100 [Coptis chinensis]|uniref:Uncharacterized protein n=1 Tax=Coptis chinensis TaxID=261450 RepID=A0A835H4A6_9MAGN|nr:hypothetical protein IFM89_004100 [Coptis chinensis]
MYVDPLMFCEFNEVVIQALGRSGDGDALEELTIEFFGTDKLFYYFAAFNMLLRNLRRVRLIGCWELNNEMIVKFVEAHPMLEEFELILMSPEIETIEGIGRSCKNLKSFRLNYRARTVQNYTDFDEESYVYEANGEATAIAKTMPNLRRLDLYGNLLGSRGLQAILDGCPHLEFLDLRQCTFISLKGDALKNCVEKVKEVKLPNNPTCLSY